MAYEQVTGIGLRRAYMGQIDEDGTIKVPAGTPVGTAYSGLRASRARALTITPAEPQRFTARGDDVNYAIFQEAPTEGPSGELRTQQADAALIALITGVKATKSGDLTMVPLQTNKVGSEDQVFVWGSRKAIESEYGQPATRRWQTYFMPSVAAAARPGALEVDAIGEFIWSLAASSSSVDPLGRAFTEQTWGCTEAAIIMLVTRYEMMLDAWIGNNSNTEFTLSQPGIVTDSTYYVTVDGADVTTATFDEGVMTLSPAPGDGAKVLALYQFQ